MLRIIQLVAYRFFLLLYLDIVLFRRPLLILRSISYLRSEPDLRSRLTPNPCEFTRTIQPKTSISFLVLPPMITSFISCPKANLSLDSMNAPLRLTLVTNPLCTLFLSLIKIDLQQRFLGNSLESISSLNIGRSIDSLCKFAI